MQDFAALRLTELSLDNALPVASGRDLTRLKLVDALDSHRPAVNPTNSQRGNRLLLTIDMTGRTSTRVSYGVISRGPTLAAGNGNFKTSFGLLFFLQRTRSDLNMIALCPVRLLLQLHVLLRGEDLDIVDVQLESVCLG